MICVKEYLCNFCFVKYTYSTCSINHFYKQHDYHNVHKTRNFQNFENVMHNYMVSAFPLKTNTNPNLLELVLV